MIRINHQASLQVPSSHWVIGPQESFVSAIPMSTLGTQNCPRSSTVSISLLMSLRTLRAEMPYNKKIYSIKPLSIISIFLTLINDWFMSYILFAYHLIRQWRKKRFPRRWLLIKVRKLQVASYWIVPIGLVKLNRIVYKWNNSNFLQ